MRTSIDKQIPFDWDFTAYAISMHADRSVRLAVTDIHMKNFRRDENYVKNQFTFLFSRQSIIDVANIFYLS